MSAIPYITVAGTWGWDATWRRPSSPWSAFMAAQGFVAIDGGRPFVWSTDVNGARYWRRWLPPRYRADHRDWMAGGHNLFAWIVPPHTPAAQIPPDDVHLITHSHGLQVALCACALGLKIATLTDIAGPVRQDLIAPRLDLLRELFGAAAAAEVAPVGIAVLARRNIGYWQHLYSDRTDRTQWFGELGDGALGIVRTHPLADANRLLPGAGHSGLLHDPRWFDQWPPVLDNIRSRARHPRS